MKFEDLKQKCLEVTKNLIQKHEWVKIQLILKDSPKQLMDVSDTLELELFKLSKNIRSSLVGKEDKKQFSMPIKIALELLSITEKALSRKCKIILSHAIIPYVDELTDDSNQLLVKALGQEILEFAGENIAKHPKILKPLIIHIPKGCINFFSEIVKNGWFELGFLFIQKYPPLLKKHSQLCKQVFVNHNYNFWQYKAMRDILFKKYTNAISIMDEVREERRSIFYEKLMNSEKVNLDFKWFNKHQIDFSVGVDLYSDNELINLVSKLLNFKILNKYPDNESRWINLCLIEIGWAKRREILEKFITQLIELNYYQVVNDYLKEKPSEIVKYKDLLIKEPRIVYSDLYQEKFDYMQINEVLTTFETWLKKGFHFAHLINIFYKNKPDLEIEFTEILERYYSSIDFSKSKEFNDYDSDDFNVIDLNNILFKVTNGNSPKYSIKFLQTKLDEFLSNPHSAPFFDPYLSQHFANNFNQLEEKTQDKIILLLIQQKKYHTLIRLIQLNYDNFKKYLDKILLLDPKETPYLRIYIVLLQIIMRKEFKEQEIFEKILNRLNKLEPIYETAQLLSYLGDHQHASMIYEELIRTEISLSSLIYIMVDYRLEKLEIKGKEYTMYEYSSISSEAIDLLSSFRQYNLNKNRISQFIFKHSYYQGRLLFSWAITQINTRIHNQAKHNLDQAFELFSSLTSKKIPSDVKNIIETYEKIVNIILLLYPVIEEHQNTDVDKINTLLSKEFDSVLKTSNLDEIRKKKVLDEIKSFKFDENGNLHQFKGEIPAPFCPKPPIINRKYLSNEKMMNIYEWDEKDRPKFYYDSIKLSKIWDKFLLVIQFAENVNSFEYEFHIECPDFVKFDVNHIDINKKQIGFEFFLRSEEFVGSLEIHLKIQPNDRCATTLNLKFPIKHMEISVKREESSERKYSNNNVNSKINLLHISDLHFGAENIKGGSKGQLIKRETTIDKLIESIQKLTKNDKDWAPDIIAVSGDVGYSGKKKEYKLAKKWLLRLLSVLDLDTENLMICPGNHDRYIKDLLSKSDFESVYPKNVMESDEMWYEDKGVDYKKRFKAFIDFAKIIVKPLKLKNEYSYLSGYRDLNGIRFIILNSARYSFGGIRDRGNLYLGWPDINKMIADDALMDPRNINEAQLTISVFHHPENWLNYTVTNEYGNHSAPYNFIAERCHIILTGHLHATRQGPPRKIGNGARHFSVGTVYLSQEYVNNCAILNIDLNQNLIKKLPISFNSSEMEWIVEKNNVESFPLVELNK